MTDYNSAQENNKDFSTRITQIMSKLTPVTKQYGNGLKFITHDQKTDYFNTWADYWRYVIGVNVIPADTKNEKY